MKQYSYYVIFVDKLIILRWPTGEVSEDTFVDAIAARVERSNLYLGRFIGGDLLVSDAHRPNSKSPLELLTEAFRGEPGLLRQFELWDFKRGRFRIVKRKWKKNKLSYQ